MSDKLDELKGIRHKLICSLFGHKYRIDQLEYMNDSRDALIQSRKDGNYSIMILMMLSLICRMFYSIIFVDMIWVFMVYYFYTSCVRLSIYHNINSYDRLMQNDLYDKDAIDKLRKVDDSICEIVVRRSASNND